MLFLMTGASAQRDIPAMQLTATRMTVAFATGLMRIRIVMEIVLAVRFLMTAASVLREILATLRTAI